MTSDDLEHCQDMCDADPDCKAINVNSDGTSCEIWNKCLPQYHSHTSRENCYVKTTGITLSTILFLLLFPSSKIRMISCS